MTWTVDTPRRIGDVTFAAIVERKVLVESVGNVLMGTARKQPLLFLQFRDGAVSAIDVNGHTYEAAEIEFLYPTAIAQVRSLIAERH